MRKRPCKIRRRILNKEEHKFIDSVSSAEVYTATLEFRSVGLSENMLPNIKFSHYFNKEPKRDDLPASYRVVLDLMDAMNIHAMNPTEEFIEEFHSDDPDERVKVLDALEQKDDTEGSTNH